MTLPSQPDLFGPQGGGGGDARGGFPKLSIDTGVRAYAPMGEFAKAPHRTAPGAPAPPPDPADAYPSKSSIKTAFDQWTAEGQPWPPPAGLTSAIASRLIPRANRTHRKWR